MKKINMSQAELIGLHVADGTLYKTNWSLVWELRGDLKESEFYDYYMTKLLFKIFNIKFYPKFRSGGKNGCYGVQTSNKIVTNFFLKYGFLLGSKSHTVRIPKYIKNSNKKIKNSFIRGLFDTDGCIRFLKINNKKIRNYPKIEFGFASKNLRDDLSKLLDELGYNHSVWGKVNFKIAISGIRNINKFMEEVSPKNVKHIKKYEFWKTKGYYLNAEVA